jgi:hypothetical protein
MEFFCVDNSKYTPKCPNCSEIIKFKINPKNFTVSYKCPKGHNKQNIPVRIFNEKYIKSSQIYKNNCSNCFHFLEDNNTNYKCEICNKLYCFSCINAHERKTKHNSKNIFICKYQLCKAHNQKFSLFCETCKNKICLKCKSTHNNHIIKSFIDIIPDKKTQDSLKSKVNDFESSINKIIDNISTIKNEVIKRYNKLNEYFRCLKNINEKLLINFNTSCYDYYNYENYNYLLKNLNDEKIILNESKYVDYLLSQEEIKENKLNKKDIKFGVDNNYIESYSNLNYLKENIFYSYENYCLKLFEFKDFSFNTLLTYDLKKYFIREVHPAKYSQFFFLEYHYRNLKFLEYDLLKKTFSISQNMINYHAYYSRIEKCFDLKDGSILVHENDKIDIWRQESKLNNNSLIDKKNAKKKVKETIEKEFKIIKTIPNVCCSINLILPDLFCFQDKHQNIIFHNTSDFSCDKIIQYNHKISFLGVINNESLIFNEYYNINSIIIINLKYLEIISKIMMDFKNENLIVRENYLMNFYIESNKLKIIKMKFDKFFEDKEIVTEKNCLEKISRIIKTDIGYLVLCNRSSISFINLN